MHLDLATPGEIAEELGQRLRAHRLAQNLRQEELALRAGVSERAVSNIERSGQGTLDSMIRIVIALGLANHFSELFEIKTRSIRTMEAVSIKRQRASRAKS
jgi:transcriptional regulator with XRE-family HTH domain